MQDETDMWKWTSLLLTVAACGFPRPADVIACTPGAFAECRGDTALTCNSAGADYDAVQCARGCDPAIGCRLCDANQTVCVNGKVQSCDATGAVTSSEACPLGCFEDQPRCREIDPSNGLAPAMDMAATGPDLVLDSAILSVPSALLTAANGERMNIRSVTFAAPRDGVPIQAFPVRSLSISGNTKIQSDEAGAIPAVAFVVYGDVTLNGTLILDSNGFPPPGSIDAGDCVGQQGIVDVSSVGYFVGGGGGGGATRGGDGGGQAYPARQGGSAFPNPGLQPLRGGCTGGTPAGFPPGYGGGAIQITSRSSIRLDVNAAVEANGLLGFAGGMPQGIPGDESVPGGGGGGGGILLEAPQVILESNATLVANGGAGTNGFSQAGTPPFGRTPSLGKDCSGATSDLCTRGGHGGSISTPDSSAPSIAFSGQQQLYTGAGGGSIGYIRINTSSGVYIEANDVFKSPIPSTGNIATR